MNRKSLCTKRVTEDQSYGAADEFFLYFTWTLSLLSPHERVLDRAVFQKAHFKSDASLPRFTMNKQNSRRVSAISQLDGLRRPSPAFLTAGQPLEVAFV